MLKHFSFRLYMLAIIICSTSVFTTSCSDDDEGIRVDNVSLNESELSIVAGQTQTLIATVTPENATNKEVIWRSSDENIAVVNEIGEVTAIAQGEVVITVTTIDGGKTDRCLFFVEKAVIPVSDISLNKNELTLMTGKKETLIAVVAPDDATNKDIIWTSDNESVAVVNEAGEVTAVSAGNAIITVATVDGNKMATCVVTVEAPKQYTVKFNTNGGNEINDVIVTEGDKLMKPEDPVIASDGIAEGLYLGTVDPERSITFDGWYIDEQFTTAYNFNAPVTADLTLYAKWSGKGPDAIDVSASSGNNILEKSFMYLKGLNLQAPASYTLIINDDITANGLTDLTNENITLTIVGKDRERIIRKTDVGNFFVIRAGTLILGNNIKVTGSGLGKYNPFYLTANGNLIMKQGSKISDMTEGMTGITAAVHMDSGLTSFTMEGGEICNNVVSATESSHNFAGAAICAFRGRVEIKGGLISNNKVKTDRDTYEIAGGIYLTSGWNTELHKTGGIIKDNIAEYTGTSTGAIGHQVLWNRGDKGFKKIDANLSESDNPSTSNADDSLWEAVE